ncbi:MAG: hypothetical protein P4L47_06220 [Mucilaginibacter sp.]|nr:hypothetical protein [Mucilaginibacter sp.]
MNKTLPVMEQPFKSKGLNKITTNYLTPRPNTYKYEERIYEISPSQLKILNCIKSLPKKNLHYLVGQQSNTHRNLTLKEMKKLIRDGVRRYVDQVTLMSNKGIENELVKYFCVFETVKDFSLSQFQNSIFDKDIFMGIHFHLFITSDLGWISFPSMFHSIYNELTHLEHNYRCISKFDYDRLEVLDDNFILYHTKQFQYNLSSEMIMTNLKDNQIHHK